VGGAERERGEEREREKRGTGKGTKRWRQKGADDEEEKVTERGEGQI